MLRGRKRENSERDEKELRCVGFETVVRKCAGRRLLCCRSMYQTRESELKWVFSLQMLKKMKTLSFEVGEGEELSHPSVTVGGKFGVGEAASNNGPTNDKCYRNRNRFKCLVF